MTSRKGPDDELPDHLFRWLEALSRRLGQEMAAPSAAPEFGADEPVDGPPLRGSQMRLLQMIPAEGSRVTDLAARARMTKQSLGEIVSRLEAAGWVGSRRDVQDARVRWVVRTAAGDVVSARASAAIEISEARLRAQVGDDRYETMKDVMRELGAGFV